ncbi:hypothetical protein HDU76_005594 [Blyttiomyces sp. JEL0837]|nr:hypothetical protein HDU76_005594 [Blyttiomyces sp. JEL0837]
MISKSSKIIDIFNYTTTSTTDNNNNIENITNNNNLEDPKLYNDKYYNPIKSYTSRTSVFFDKLRRRISCSPPKRPRLSIAFILLASLIYLISVQLISWIQNSWDDDGDDGDGFDGGYGGGGRGFGRRVGYKKVRIGEAVVGLNLMPFLGLDRGYADKEKMEFIKNMTIHAWTGYKKYAWGYDDLLTRSQKGHNWHGPFTLLNTPVDSLDTLLIMNLETEYEEAKNLVLSELYFNNITEGISVFETTIRVLGGLLAAFDLEGDVRLLEKARDLGDLLLPAFETENGLPLNYLNVSSGVARDRGGGFSSVMLAEVGSLQLEMQYLSDLTGDNKYAIKSLYVWENMRRFKKPIPGLFPSFMSTSTINTRSECQDYRIGGMADSFYEYLMKMYLATGEETYYDFYQESAEAMISYMATETPDRKYVYMPMITYTPQSALDYPFIAEQGMEHLACFSGGMFAMGALSKRRGTWTDQLHLGRKITETCAFIYNSTATGLGPERMNMITMTPDRDYYALRPEVIESIFYMWRLTHDPWYREQGWNIAQALEKHCKSDWGGYHGIKGVNVAENHRFEDKMESFFIAETLKYLYLLFTDDDVIPLEKYVFNTEAHPLSVRGHGRRANPEYLMPIPMTEEDFGIPFLATLPLSEELLIKRQFGW